MKHDTCSRHPVFKNYRNPRKFAEFGVKFVEILNKLAKKIH